MHTSSEHTPTIVNLERVIDSMMSTHILNSHERFSNELQHYLHEARGKGIEQTQAAEIMLERMKIHSISLPFGVSVETFESKQSLVSNLQ